MSDLVEGKELQRVLGKGRYLFGSVNSRWWLGKQSLHTQVSSFPAFNDPTGIVSMCTGSGATRPCSARSDIFSRKIFNVINYYINSSLTLVGVLGYCTRIQVLKKKKKKV